MSFEEGRRGVVLFVAALAFAGAATTTALIAAATDLLVRRVRPKHEDLRYTSLRDRLP